MVNIKLKTPKTTFDLSFSGKYNIIIGDSGTKKSFFVNIAASSYKPNKLFHMDLSIDGKFIDKSCVHVITNHHNNNELGIMKRYKGHVFIIDEFSDIFSNKDLPSTVRDSENYFIFISRKIYGWLPVGVDSIYQFQIDGKNVSNVPVYCQDNSDLTDIHFGIKYGILEDSKSSRFFFKKYFPNIELCPPLLDLGGRYISMDNAHVHYSLINSISNGKNDILVVFDASAYGSFYHMLIAVLKGNPSIRISILPWESYEHYLLKCQPFNLNLTKESIGCSYASLEQLAEERLHEITGYQKDRPLICFNGCSYCTRKCVYRNHEINFINYPLTLLTAPEMNLFE